jgi:hypothetical protein
MLCRIGLLWCFERRAVAAKHFSERRIQVLQGSRAVAPEARTVHDGESLGLQLGQLPEVL